MHTSGRRLAPLVALFGCALLLGTSVARAQIAGDPLTGATPDPGAGLGTKAVEAIYFDAKGNVTDNISDAVKYSVTDNVQGVSTIPKPISQMTPQERQRIGLPEAKAQATKTATTPDKPADAPAKDPAARPAPKPAGGSDPAKKDPAPKASPGSSTSRGGEPQVVPGTEETDPATGIVYGDVKDQLVAAARDSFSDISGVAPSAPPAAAGGEQAHAFVAPAVAAQAAVIGPAGPAPRGYRALSALVGLRQRLIAGIEAYFSTGSDAGLSTYGASYDGAPKLAAAEPDTRATDERFAVAQQASQE